MTQEKVEGRKRPCPSAPGALGGVFFAPAERPGPAAAGGADTALPAAAYAVFLVPQPLQNLAVGLTVSPQTHTTSLGAALGSSLGAVLAPQPVQKLMCQYSVD
jgi:hypothetical protein